MKISLAEYWASFEAAVIPATEKIAPEHRRVIWASFYAGAKSCFRLCNLFAEGKVSEDDAVRILTNVQRELFDHHEQVREILKLDRQKIQ